PLLFSSLLFSSLLHLAHILRTLCCHASGELRHSHCRATCWMMFLNVLPSDQPYQQWRTTLQQHRDAYVWKTRMLLVVSVVVGDGAGSGGGGGDGAVGGGGRADMLFVEFISGFCFRAAFVM